ncbi:MAG: tetratricopeptide repeat protein [Acidobacteria bacterium]|nr:tetratricopeptide repeat protein [Acidobacteriota bacterium]
MRRLAIVLFILTLPLSGHTACLWAQAAPQSKGPEQSAVDSYHYVPPPAWKSVEIGNFYLTRKDYRGAISRYKEAIRTESDYAPAYLQLGKVYEKLGRKREALAEYRKYLDELPSEKQAEEAKGAHKAIRRLERELQESRRAREKSRTAQK